MATYPVRHKETGETKEVKMSIHDWDQWKIDNTDWERYFNAENSPGLGVEISDWQSRLIKQKPEWNEVLGKAQKAPGSTVKKL